MMLRLITPLIAVLALLTGSIANAQGPAGPWASGIACVNLDNSNQASITLTFYSQGSGIPVLVYSDTIPPGGSKNYFTPSTPPGVPNNFLGSVVVASSTPVSCNVNTQKLSSGTQSDPYRIGTSAGISDAEAAPTVYAPQVMKNFGGWNSYIAVQNTTMTTVTVSVSYKDNQGAAIPAANETASIPPQSTHVFYQNQNTGLPNNFLGSAIVSATDGTSKLAVVVNFYNSGLDSTRAQLHSYNAFVQGGSKLFVPRFVRNYYGYNSGLSVQNIGNIATTVRITFNFGLNAYVYTSNQISPGAALFLYAPNISQLNPVDLLPVGQRFGNAVIEVLSGGPIVAIVNEDNRGGPNIPLERAGQGSTYNAIIDGTQTTKVFFPQVPRKVGGIFSGGFQIANTTGTAGTCNITYAGAPQANETNVPLPPFGSIARYAPNVPNLPNGFNAAVTVVCTQPIVGISNIAVEPGSGRYGDSFTQANGLNQ